MNTILQKRLMAFAGIVWFVYLILHMLVNLNFLSGAEDFNGFYRWFNHSVILRWSIIILLIVTFLLHVYVAIKRQLDNNKKRTIGYHKDYPEVIPRWLAWSGATILLSFIVFHFFQMQLLPSDDFYQEVVDIFTQPVMFVIYALGFTALTTHLHHALSNVLQTYGLTHHQCHYILGAVLVLLIGGFLSVPLTIYLS